MVVGEAAISPFQQIKSLRPTESRIGAHHPEPGFHVSRVSGKGGAFLTGFRGSRFPILGAGIRAQFDARWLP
jgi:hypothetical protein